MKAHRNLRRTVLIAVATAAAALVPASALGQLPAPPVVGARPLQVGGYASVTVSRPEHPEEAEGVEVSELAAAVMAWGGISTRLSYLVELDVAKRTSETWTGREADQRLVLERMYLEYTASPLARVRLGRFLTPVGVWNEQHAEPLTWTPTRPLTTYLPFAKSLTGVLLAGAESAGGHDIGYAVYWAPRLGVEGELEEAEESAFVHAYGGRAAIEVRPGLTFGLAVAHFRRSRPAEEPTAPSGGVTAEEREEDETGRTLLGADARWVTGRVELVGEANVIPRSEEAPAEGGAYVMASVRLTGPLWAVVRGETYQPIDGRTERIGFAGLTLRADRHLVVKVGRQFVEHTSIRIPDGWFLSLSSLF